MGLCHFSVPLSRTGLAAGLSQQFELSLGLDAFGGDAHAQVGREVDDPAYDAGALVLLFQVADEGPVDLDGIEGKAAEVGQGRIAGAEIVQRDARAECVQADRAAGSCRSGTDSVISSSSSSRAGARPDVRSA